MRSAVILEIVNGAWTILTALFVIFLAYHLWCEGQRRRFSTDEWFGPFPLGMQVAVALLVADIGTVISRGAAWSWFLTTEARGPIEGIVGSLLVIGSFIAAIGILCQIRIFSKGYFGNAPWILAAVMSIIYVVLAWMHYFL